MPRTEYWTLCVVFFICHLLVLGCGGGEQPTSDVSQLNIDARKYLAEGSSAQALVALNASIAVEPRIWALKERAKLNAEAGNDKAAIADCDAALKLAPDDPDALWLKGEFAKPAAQRFQGKLKTAPSSNR